MDYGMIGQQIRKYRKQRGLSQEELAERVYISTTHMSHIETGSTKLSLPVLVDIAAVLETGVDALLRVDDTAVPADALEEINGILESCTPQQSRVIADLVKTAKHSMDKYL